MLQKFGSIITHRPTENLWKLGLGPKEIKKYSKVLKKIRQQDGKITMKRLLESNVTFAQKRDLIHLYDSLQLVEKYSSDYYLIVAEIEKILAVNVLAPNLTNREQALQKILNTEKSLLVRILEADMDDARCAAIYEKYLQLKETPQDSTTFASLEEWINYALKTPSRALVPPSDAPIDILSKLRESLDQELFGMNEAKEHILAIFCKRLANPDAKGLAIGLVGSPGTGKSSFAKAIANALGSAFQQISLGGIVDSSILDGQHPGWVGSRPGRIASALAEMGIVNGVLFFDEADKLSTTKEGLNVQHAMLHTIDPEQNNALCDHYLGSKLPIDISRCILIYAMNSTEGLDPAFLNRIPIVRVPNNTVKEKIVILREYLLPRLLASEHLDPNDITISKGVAAEFVRYADPKNSGGVRNIEHALSTVVSKCSMLLRYTFEQQQLLKLSFAMNIAKPVELTMDIIKKLYIINGHEPVWNGMYT